ncbi:MAG TPA: GNAT family N-acyltransferase [Chthoniobacterales bacterium]
MTGTQYGQLLPMILPSAPPSVGASILCGTQSYSVRIAKSRQDLEKAQRLRFEVFNLELHEGLDSAYLTGLDCDPFDEVCDHLLVEHIASSTIVGTYRLQTGLIAAAGKGYYSANEFDFSPFESIRHELVEAGRACVHSDHRNLSVIHLLWRGIALYSQARGVRYLIGCSSINSQDPAEGWGTYKFLEANALVEPRFRTTPLQGLELPTSSDTLRTVRPPRLLRAYLTVGAKVCGPPAIDREFRTIDFLTFMDLEGVPDSVRTHFLV